jgi:nucleoside-diphosphate-sugar epimerase
MNILVTGRAGFIGHHLVDGLPDKGHNIRILVASVSMIHGKSPKWPIWLSKDIEKIRGDVIDSSIWKDIIINGFNGIYHFAAEGS